LFAATDLLQCAQLDADYLGNIIKGEKTWNYGYNPEIKAQSSVWKTPSSQWWKKAGYGKSKTKVLLIVFFDQDGAVRHKFTPMGQAVHKDYYYNICGFSVMRYAVSD
jgi:hypothetical protein